MWRHPAPQDQRDTPSGCLLVSQRCHQDLGLHLGDSHSWPASPPQPPRGRDARVLWKRKHVPIYGTNACTRPTGRPTRSQVQTHCQAQTQRPAGTHRPTQTDAHRHTRRHSQMHTLVCFAEASWTLAFPSFSRRLRQSQACDCPVEAPDHGAFSPEVLLRAIGGALQPTEWSALVREYRRPPEAFICSLIVSSQNTIFLSFKIWLLSSTSF